jgi:hypothetical protein
LSKKKKEKIKREILQQKQEVIIIKDGNKKGKVWNGKWVEIDIC